MSLLHTVFPFTWIFFIELPQDCDAFGMFDQVKQHGVAIFLMQSGMLGTLLSLIDVLPLFSNTLWGQNANIAFLKKHMGASFEKRPQPWQANISVADVHSGDFLAISKIRGRWGGFESLEKWVTGAFAGHTAICLKDEDGNLWVGESGHENEKVRSQMFKILSLKTDVLRHDSNAIYGLTFHSRDFLDGFGRQKVLIYNA